MKAKLILPAMVFALICFFSLNAHANGWTDGWDVVSCGMEGNVGMYVRITDGTSTPTYYADDSIAGFTNRALALCLSAQAATKKINIRKMVGGKFQKIYYQP